MIYITANALIDRLKREGYTKEEILISFYKLYEDKKISKNDLNGIIKIVG